MKSDFFADRLLQAIADKQAPICVGIDPIIAQFPETLRARIDRRDVAGSVDALFEFCQQALKVVAPHVPAVKFQSAYFEQFAGEGVNAYFSLIQEARSLGLIVIGDVKRGDIGSTAEAYAAAHLDEGHLWLDGDEEQTPDAITVNPFCGLDTIEPFVTMARQQRKGLFVLVRTSNPGSALLQDAILADGRTWSQMLAGELNKLATQAELIGQSGYSGLGAVVGATQPQAMIELRQLLPQSIFLLPGYGAQGATAQMTRAAFVDGQGALVSASRSILFAHLSKQYAGESDWRVCVEKAVLAMKQDLRQVLNG